MGDKINPYAGISSRTMEIVAKEHYLRHMRAYGQAAEQQHPAIPELNKTKARLQEAHRVMRQLQQAIAVDLMAARSKCEGKEGCATTVPCADCPHNPMPKTMAAVVAATLQTMEP